MNIKIYLKVNKNKFNMKRYNKCNKIITMIIFKKNKHHFQNNFHNHNKNKFQKNNSNSNSYKIMFKRNI